MSRVATDPMTSNAVERRRPSCLAETGLPPEVVDDLLLKHLFGAGVVTLAALSERLALAGAILEDVLNGQRGEALVEVRGPAAGHTGLRYALTERGRAAALDALARSGYVGPAPVPLEDYRAAVEGQSLTRHPVSREQLLGHFENTVIAEDLLDRLGPAANSGRALFVYGPPGTGKSYICRKLGGVFGDTVAVPYAILVGEVPLPVFDPALHERRATAPAGLMFDEGEDPRWVRCARPVAITGGELTLDLLETQYSATRREYSAPLQLKANNGMLFIDDLGRQRVAATELLNRWIVPMEDGRDFLYLKSGRHFSVPFDLFLVFSTNLDPRQLADEAFLRRIGHKVHFGHLTVDEYRAVWRQECAARGVAPEDGPLEFVLERHRHAGVPLLPCHPRDLIGLALDYARYRRLAAPLSRTTADWAWNNYFVNTECADSGRESQ